MSTWRSIEQELAAQLQRDEASLRVAYNELIGRSFADIESQIAAFYEKYSTEEVLAYRDMLGNLSADDYALLYENMNLFVAKYPEYASMMPLSKSMYELTRLEALQAQILMAQGKLSSEEAAILEAHLARWGTNYANGALTSVISQAGPEILAQTTMHHVNDALILTALKNPWSGKSFSKRIWANNEVLGNFLNNEFVQAVSRGDSYAKLIKGLKSVYGDVSRKSIYRLIYTEGTYITNETSAKAFEQDFDQYILAPVHDAKTCPICLSIEDVQKKSPANFKDRITGENFPPIHPWCRCSFIVHVPDWDTWIDERTGRADTAKRTSVRYTEEELITRWTGQDYRAVRAYQSKGQVFDTVPDVAEFSDALEAHIKNSPKYKGKIYRGVNMYNQDVYDSLKSGKGEIIKQPGTSSWTQSELQAKQFASPYEDNRVVFVVPKSTQGVDIAAISDLPGEAEIIMSKDQRWEIERTKSSKDGILYVYLKEVIS